MNEDDMLVSKKLWNETQEQLVKSMTELAELKKALPTSIARQSSTSGTVCGSSGGASSGKDVSVSIGVTHPGDKHLGGGAGVKPPSADGNINYVVLVACKDSTSHINNGEALTWAEAYKAIGDQLEKWIDQDGLNVRNVTISATRDAVYQRRTGPV